MNASSSRPAGWIVLIVRVTWGAHFAPTQPAPEAWRDALLPELSQLIGRLRQHHSRLIALRPKAHLSAALAFGYTFRTTTGFQLWVEQATNQWWRISGPAADDPGVRVEEIALDRGGDTVIEVSVARDAGAAVQVVH